MCFMNDKLILTGHSFHKSGDDIIRVYHQETGEIIREWTKCHGFSCVAVIEVEGREKVLEGCSKCKVIRGYDLNHPEDIHTILHEGIRPSLMSKWWRDSEEIMVFEEAEEEKRIKLFQYRDHQLHLDEQFPVWLDDIAEICYSKSSGNIIFLHDNKKSVTGFPLGMKHQIAWQYTNTQSGSCINDIAILPDGQVCAVINYMKVYILDSKKGSFLYKLPDSEHLELGSIWAVATCYCSRQQKLAIKHGKPEETQITCYRVESTQPPGAQPVQAAAPFESDHYININTISESYSEETS